MDKGHKTTAHTTQLAPFVTIVGHSRAVGHSGVRHRYVLPYHLAWQKVFKFIPPANKLLFFVYKGTKRFFSKTTPKQNNTQTYRRHRKTKFIPHIIRIF